MKVRIFQCYIFEKKNSKITKGCTIDRLKPKKDFFFFGKFTFKVARIEQIISYVAGIQGQTVGGGGAQWSEREETRQRAYVGVTKIHFPIF